MQHVHVCVRIPSFLVLTRVIRTSSVLRSTARNIKDAPMHPCTPTYANSHAHLRTSICSGSSAPHPPNPHHHHHTHTHVSDPSSTPPVITTANNTDHHDHHHGPERDPWVVYAGGIGGSLGKHLCACTANPVIELGLCNTYGLHAHGGGASKVRWCAWS